jgi:two-component system nitrate/nitrite response regulator NarL
MVSTIVIDPRALVRGGLVSLVESHSYCVIGQAASARDIDAAAVDTAPRLVILAGNSMDRAAAEASNVRRLWRDSKIILLSEQASGADLNRLLTSQIDACIPLSVSAETLLGTVQSILDEGLRIFIGEMSAWPSTPMKNEPSAWGATGPVDCVAASVTEARLRSTGLQMGAVKPKRNGAGHASAFGSMPNLSEREEDILKNLVNGSSNKLIARICTVTEATVKVHIKSILRKTRVANRTQAAIWALENGYAAA